jgi:hypothetical protein
MLRTQAGENRGSPTRNLLKRIATALEITDLIALMMVVVTGLSAYATWKTAQVTNQILLTSQRPYIGVESVNLVDEANPRVVVDLGNFGSVQAEDATISIVLEIAGKALSGDSESQLQNAPIVLSLAVPHRFYRHLSADTYPKSWKARPVWWFRSSSVTEARAATSTAIRPPMGTIILIATSIRVAAP